MDTMGPLGQLGSLWTLSGQSTLNARYNLKSLKNADTRKLTSGHIGLGSIVDPETVVHPWQC